KAIRQGLADANRLPDIDGRAWTLHYVAARVQMGVRPGGMPIVTGEGRTVWERLAGGENVAKIGGGVLPPAVYDPPAHFSRDGRFPMDREQLAQLKKQMVHLASAVGGGPLTYQGKGMKEAHKDMGITSAEFDALRPHLRIALLKNGVKPPEVVAIMEMIE